MGKDGADGLLAMRLAQCATFVQDEESSIVYGMAGSALAIDAAEEVVDMDRIAVYLTKLVTM